MSDKFLDPESEFNFDSGGSEDAEGMVMNLDNVDESLPAFEPLRPGIYECIVENTEFGSSKAGNPMITWVFKVTDPEFESRLLFNHTVLNSEAGQSRLKRLLLRVVPDVDLSKFNPKAFCEEGIAVGLPCQVKVNVRPYQGQRRNNVVDVLAPKEGGSFLDEEL